MGTRVRRSLVAVGVVLALGAGCKKDDKGGQQKPVEPTPGANPAAPDPSGFQAPALFAHIPADTPYVLASFEAIPLDVYGKMRDAIGPALSESMAMFRGFAGDSEGGRVYDALMKELDGKWNAAGLQSLGFSPTPRFAVYGIGLLPVVFRLELADDRAVYATIDRIAKAAGLALPAPEKKGDVEFWRLPLEDDMGMILSLAKKQAVLAIGPRTAIGANIDVILGIALPPSNMADGAALKGVMAMHGFGPHLIGYADTKRIAGAALDILGRPTSPACRDAVTTAAGRVPRLAIGYDLSVKLAKIGMVAEMAPDLARDVAAAATEIPGLATVLASEPIFAFGGGFDLAKARALGGRFGTALTEIGTACNEPGMIEGGNELAGMMAMPLPDALGQITGGLASLTAIELAAQPGAFPVTSMKGFALVSHKAPKTLFDFMIAQEPNFGRLGVAADGKMHAVDLKSEGVPFPIHAGVGAHGLVVSVGDQALGDKALAFAPAGKSPLLAITMDYGKFMELVNKLQNLGGGYDDPMLASQAGLDAKLAALYGRSDMTLDVNDKGLRFFGTIEMK